MADSGLNVGAGTGTQGSSGSSLQGSTANLSNNLSGRVQTGVSSDQLKSTSGVTLNPTQLSTVSLSGNASGPVQVPTSASHHFSPVLLALCVGLFLVAAISVWLVAASGKKHNQY